MCFELENASWALPAYILVLLYLQTAEMQQVVLKMMSPILRCWPTMSEADGSDMGVEAEASHQCSAICCCLVTDGSTGAL